MVALALRGGATVSEVTGEYGGAYGDLLNASFGAEVLFDSGG
jgi:hypothetical protein